MAKSVIVCCKLPNGIILEHPLDPAKTVELNGKNKSQIIGAEYSTTEVDENFWVPWFEVNQEFPAIKSGAIFVAKSAPDAAAIAKEFADRKTGLEPMRTDGKDDRAKGVKTADKD